MTRKLKSALGRRCQACGNPINSPRPDARYCSNSCQQYIYRLRRHSKTVVIRGDFIWVEGLPQT